MLKIRRYRTEDNKAIKELNSAGMTQMDPTGEIHKIPHVDDDLDDIEGIYLSQGDFIVGIEGDEVVAMGAFKRMTPQCAEFKRLRIRPDRQRQGYGEVIMRRLMELAADMGYTEGFLDTLVTNTRAQKLFEKCGWVKRGGGKRGGFALHYYRKKLNHGGE
ncbi:MAG: GNAT family N-acetyltransferase [Dehalococcoidales bacterium]|jgi:ribosomal protein S18 acetylase RimI-like enzyme